MAFMNPNPTCTNECRFSPGLSMTTAVYYAPIYDKYGNNVNPDRNMTSGSINCHTCNRSWTYYSDINGIEYKETK